LSWIQTHDPSVRAEEHDALMMYKIFIVMLNSQQMSLGLPVNLLLIESKLILEEECRLPGCGAV
jgi:hypothetical protein